MAENNEVAAAPKTGKLKTMILLVAVVVLAVALSIAGTLWFLSRGGDGGGQAAETASGEPPFRPALYLEMDQPLVTTVRHPGRQRYVQVHLAFEAVAQAPLTALSTHLPLVRNELISTLGAMDYMALQGADNRAEVPERLLEAVNRVLESEGAPPVQRVLLRNFVIQ